MLDLRRLLARARALRQFRRLIDRLIGVTPPEQTLIYFAQSEVNVTHGHRPTVHLGSKSVPLVWHLVKDQGSSNGLIISYWRSKEAFDRDSADWRKAMSLGPILQRGWILQVEGYVPPPWKRFKLVSVVVAMAGVLAASQTIKNHGDYWFAEPAVALRGVPKPAEFIAGEPVEFGAEVVNQLGAVHQEIEIGAEILRLGSDSSSAPPVASHARVAEPLFPELAARERRTVSVATAALPAGDYIGRIRASAKLGQLRPPARPMLEVPIKVWPAQPTIQIRGETFAPMRGAITGSVQLGPDADDGLQCELVIPGTFNLRHLVLNLAGAARKDQEWVPSPGQADGVHVLFWRTEKVKGKRTVDFRAYFEASGKVPSWDEIAKATRSKCRI